MITVDVEAKGYRVHLHVGGEISIFDPNGSTAGNGVWTHNPGCDGRIDDCSADLGEEVYEALDAAINYEIKRLEDGDTQDTLIPPPGVITTVLLDDEVENEAWWAAAARHLDTAPSWAEDFLCSRQEQLELVDSEVAELRAWIATFYDDDGTDSPILFSEPIDSDPNSRMALEGPPDLDPDHEFEGWSITKRSNNTEWCAERFGLHLVALHSESFEELLRKVAEINRLTR